MADGRGLSAHEVGERDIEGVREEQQVSEVGRGLGGLPPVDRLVVTADALAELDLRQASGAAVVADACPDDPAAGVYPVGQGVSWHPTTLE